MDNQKRSILLIDDDPFLVDMYTLKFQEGGFEVKSARDGQTALDILKQDSLPDLILLDVVMPHLDGFEILKILKADERLKSIPVILLTNVGQKDDVEKGITLGADDYIVKAHFTPSEVVERVNKLLKNK